MATNLYYGYAGNNPVTFIDPLGLDIYYLNRKSDVLGAGHNAVLIGNGSSGYEFRSFRPANVLMGKYFPELVTVGSSAVDKVRFDNLSDALAYANQIGYLRYIGYATCESSDAKALAAADAWAPYYDLRFHQSDNFTTAVLGAGGINAPTLSTPNLSFQLMRNYGGWFNAGYSGEFGFTGR